jgi:hypothetical protein
MNSKWQLLLGRVLLSMIFLLSGLGKLPHFHDIAGMMAAKGIPLASLALVITLFIEIGGGLLVLGHAGVPSLLGHSGGAAAGADGELSEERGHHGRPVDSCLCQPGEN